jgi:hypothetical protein
MKTGDWLPNGAVVLFERSGVVLAHSEGAVQPFVTWEWDGNDPATTIWGHYYRSIGAAAYDFESRAIMREKRNAESVGSGT